MKIAPTESARGAIGRRILAAAIAMLMAIAAIPALAQEYGGIELGSTGIKRGAGKILNGVFDSDPKYEHAENIGLADSLKAGNVGGEAAQTKAIADAGKIIERYMAEFENRKLPREKIFIAISSGLKAAAGGDAQDRSKPLSALVEEVRRVTGREPIVIDGEQEAKLTFDDLVTGTERDKVLVIDVGGTNLKIGSSIKERNCDINLGARSFANSVTDKAKRDEAQKSVGDLIKNTVRITPASPVVAVYISGGSAYTAATYLAPEKLAEQPSGTHKFSLTDISKLSSDLLNANSVAQVLDEKIAVLKQKPETKGAADLLSDVKGKVGGIEQLRAGVWLLATALAEVEAANKSSTLEIRFRGGLLTWLKPLIVQEVKKIGDPLGKLQEDVSKLTASVGELDGKLAAELQSINEAIKAGAKSINESNAKNGTQLGALERRLGEIVELLKEDAKARPGREDLERLGKSLEAKLERIATAIQNQVPPTFDRERATYLYNEGLFAFQQSHFPAAHTLFKGSVEQYPGNATAWYYRSVTELALGKNAEAAASIQQCARLIGSDQMAYGTLCRAMEKVQGAVRNRAEEMLAVARAQPLAAP